MDSEPKFHWGREFVQKELKKIKDKEPGLSEQGARDHLAQRLKNQMLRREIARKMKDSLSGLHNKDYFLRKLREIFALNQRKKGEMTLLILDSDNLKAINESQGHPAGDQHIKALGEIIGEIFRRQTDLKALVEGAEEVTARYGGDEFVVLLPSTPLADGLMLAEKVRKMAEEQLGTTVSIGAASFPNDNISSPDDLFNAADSALLAVKHNGKNNTAVWRGSGNIEIQPKVVASAK